MQPFINLADLHGEGILCCPLGIPIGKLLPPLVMGRNIVKQNGFRLFPGRSCILDPVKKAQNILLFLENNFGKVLAPDQIDALIARCII